jgi:hypothetical protein
MARAYADEDRQEDKRNGDLAQHERPPPRAPAKLVPGAGSPMPSGREPGQRAGLG